MGLLNVVSSALSPGKLVKEAVDAVLPEKFDAVAGLAGAIVDFKSGNPLQAAQHLAQALKDLPQMLAEDKSVKDPPPDRNRGTAAFEPTPPPSRGNGSERLDWKMLADLFEKVRDFVAKRWLAPSESKPQQPPAEPAASPGGWARSMGAGVGSAWRETVVNRPNAASGGWRGAPPEEAPKPSAGSSSSRKPSSTTKASASSSSSSSSKKSSSSSTTKSTSTSSTKKKEEARATTKPSSEKKASGSAAVDKLNKISNDDLLKMVRTGNIPDEVFDDPKAKLALQERIQHLTEMTKLMTQLMQALHDIRMSVLHNVRA